jgi:hypothetical protein
MTAAANTPHTITNALMICFSSETDAKDVYQTSSLVVCRLAFLQTLQRQARVALGLFVAGLLDLLDGPYQGLNDTLLEFIWSD